ncbi:MAG: flagellar basal body-associated FliL family protein [Micavibrio sp.]
MKLGIIALLAVLILGGGAAGAYFYFDRPAVASQGPANETAMAAHEEKLQKAADTAQTTSEFVQIDALIFPVIGERGLSQTISLVVTIEAPDTLAAEEVRRLMPRLKDAYIQDIYGSLSRAESMENGAVRIAPLKARLSRISHQVLGEEKVSDVLLQIVHQRPL